VIAAGCRLPTDDSVAPPSPRLASCTFGCGGAAPGDIGFQQYYQAEQTGWVLYLEGSTDLSVMQACARRLGHEEAVQALDRPLRALRRQPAGHG